MLRRFVVFGARGVSHAITGIFSNVNNVQVRLVHALQRPSRRTDANRHGAVHSRDFHAIAGFGLVDEFVENAHRNSVWGFTLGNRVRRLLHFDGLLVREDALVMNQRHRPWLSALRTLERGLVHASTINLNVLGGEPAHQTFEVRELQIGNNRRASRHHPAHAHHLVNVRRIQVTHRLGVHHVERSNDDSRRGRVFVHIFGRDDVFQKVIVCHDVKERNNLLRIMNQLLVQKLIVLVHVLAIQIQVRVLFFVNLSHALVVVRIRGVGQFKVFDKPPKALLRVEHVHPRPPNVRLRRHFIPLRLRRVQVFARAHRRRRQEIRRVLRRRQLCHLLRPVSLTRPRRAESVVVPVRHPPRPRAPAQPQIAPRRRSRRPKQPRRPELSLSLSRRRHRLPRPVRPARPSSRRRRKQILHRTPSPSSRALVRRPRARRRR